VLHRALRPVWIALLLAAAGGFIAVGFYLDHIFPFDLDRPPSVITKFHLRALAREPDRCFAALDRAGIEYGRAPEQSRGNGCGFDDAVRLNKSGIGYGSRVLLRCPAMLSLLLWERHVLQPAASEEFGRKISSVRHLGTYACRNIGRQKNRALSEHATANAIDIASFTLEGGESMSVLRDWNDAGAKGRFLRKARDGACDIFSATLSPDFNKAHANHFHLDRGARTICR
jgi:hypothetical protein